MALLVVALLAAGELAWAAKPLLLQHQNGQTRASSTPGLTPVSPAVFASLAARPLHFPAGITLATCPVSSGQQTNTDFYDSVAGTGPLYVGVVSPDGSVAYTPASTWGDGYGWGGIPGSFWTSRGSFSGAAELLLRSWIRRPARVWPLVQLYQGPLPVNLHGLHVVGFLLSAGDLPFGRPAHCCRCVYTFPGTGAKSAKFSSMRSPGSGKIGHVVAASSQTHGLRNEV